MNTILWFLTPDSPIVPTVSPFPEFFQIEEAVFATLFLEDLFTPFITMSLDYSPVITGAS